MGRVGRRFGITALFFTGTKANPRSLMQPMRINNYTAAIILSIAKTKYAYGSH
jgi:hypothetical protein